MYAANPDRVKRNRSLVGPLKDLFRDLLGEYNNAVFDNGTDCRSYNENTLELIPGLSNVDLAYFDPPIATVMLIIRDSIIFLETFTNYWKDKAFVNRTKRYSPKKISGFDTKKDIVNSFEALFESSKDIPYWLISYNDRSYPSIDVLIEMIRPYRQVNVERRVYLSGRGGKGSVAGSSEILLICTP